MRLVKLLAYSLLGYVLYELYLGMTEGAQADESASSGRIAGNPRRGSADTTGSGGRQVEVEDPNGARTTRSVGRGVR